MQELDHADRRKRCLNDIFPQSGRSLLHAREIQITAPSGSDLHPTIVVTQTSGDTETATLDHHPHNNPASSQGLTGSVSLLTDSVTNA